MRYFIIRRELHGKLSYSLQDAKPNYSHGEFADKWRRDNELIIELIKMADGKSPSLTVLRAHAKAGTLGTSGYIKRVVNWPVEKHLQMAEAQWNTTQGQER